MEIFYAIIVMTVNTLLYEIIKTHKNAQLKWLNFTLNYTTIEMGVRKQYLGNVSCPTKNRKNIYRKKQFL